MEHLHSTPIIDGYDTVYGIEPPSRNALSSKTNEIIDEIEVLKAEIEKLKKPKWQSGYLRSIYG